MTPEQQRAIAIAKAKIKLAQANRSAQPASPLPENPVLQETGPGPTGRIDPALYEIGAIGRRFVPGEAPQEAPVVAADGTQMVFNPQTGQYTSRELLAGNMRPNAGEAFLAGAAQGVTMGTGDEIAGAIGGDFLREKGRAALDAARRDRPGATFAGEIGGALSIPAPGPARGATLKEAVTTGAKVAGTLGGVYAAASADGGVINRVEEGLKGAVAGALFGAAVPVAVNVGTKAFRSIFKASAQRPTLESLRATKNVAYDAVDKAGEKFGPDEMGGIAKAARAGLDDVDYLPEADTVTTGMMARLDSMSEREITLGQLDKFRQRLWTRYNNSKEPGLLEMIDAIDEAVASRADTSELLSAARLANARYKKAELLDLAFQKARDQTASTGSGGNILNKYRQAVTSIINNPKQAKWFSAEEIATMRQFIEGTTGQNAMRLVGKLAPTGNGLMLALNLGGAANFGAGSLAVTAGAAGAKAIADAATEKGAQALIGKVSGGSVAPGPIRYPGRLNALAGPLGP